MRSCREIRRVLVRSPCQPALSQADVASVAAQQTESALAAHPEAEIITQDRPTGGCHDHQHNGQVVRRSGIDGSNQQHGLAWEWNLTLPYCRLLFVGTGRYWPIVS